MDASPHTGTSSPGRPKRSRGQAVVEFALILPVFLLLLLLAIDFGRLFFTYIQLNNTAREGAAYAAANPTTDNATLTTAALRESNVQAQRGESAVAATAACVDSLGNALVCSSALGGSGAGNRVTVSVGERFTFFTPLIGSFWPGGLRVGTSATAAVVDYAAGGGTPPATCSTTPPTPSFTWQSPDPVNHPFLISVDAHTSPSLASPCQNVGYNWDFGGASADPSSDYLREGVTQDYEYATAGTYIVTLVVSNAAGDSPSTTQTITLGTTTCNAPVASFTVSPAAIVDKHGNITNWSATDKHGNLGTSFNFDGSTNSSFMSDPACHPVWSWDLGDLTTPAPSTSAVLNHIYSHAYTGATVHVILKVTNDAGSNTSPSFDIPLQ
jgi:Flp pilus assembly protein TadG